MNRGRFSALILLLLLLLLSGETCFGRRNSTLLIKRKTVPSTYDRNPLHAVVTVVRGEADFIVEWINYHTWLGYRRFYIYNQDDDPKLLERLLASYTSAGIVVLKHWPIVGDQRGSYLDFISEHAHAVSSFTFLDGDEFLCLCKHATINSFLAQEMGPRNPQGVEQKPSCLELPWYMFGTSDLPFHPPRTSVLTQFFHRAKCPFRVHAGKVIVQAGKRYKGRKKADIVRHTGTMHHYCREHTNGSSAIQPEIASIYHYSLRQGDLSFAARVQRGTQGDFSGQTMYEGMTSDAVSKRNEQRDATMLRILDYIPDLLVARPLNITRQEIAILKCPDSTPADLACEVA